jgi:hypothetical protein
MSVADDGSFFSRFTVKFVEITAAGIATAVSGFLIAHVAGFFSAVAVTPSAVPAAVQIAPGGSAVTGSLPVQPAAPPVAAAEPRFAPEHPEHNVSTADRPAASAAPAMPARKPKTADADAPESRPADPPRDLKPDLQHDMDAIEAKVRAALAKADAARPTPHEAPARAADVPADTPSPTAAVQPRPAAAGPAVIAATPRNADVAPPPAERPLVPAPLGTLDIPSRPVAAVAPSAPPDEETTQASAQTNEPNGIANFFAAFKRIPDRLREDTPVPASEVPRPPMPVGQ